MIDYESRIKENNKILKDINKRNSRRQHKEASDFNFAVTVTVLCVVILIWIIREVWK